MKQNIINHVALVVDDSGSMRPLLHKMISLIDRRVAELEAESRANKQETRLSIYTFGERVTPIVFDRALNTIPSADVYYRASQGHTALIDGVTTAIKELKSIDTRRDDHAFLIEVITDGEENVNPTGGPKLRKLIASLSEDWTVTASVPNMTSLALAKQYGLHEDNIQVWEQTEVGVEKAFDAMKGATQSYMMSRSLGQKGTKAYFQFKNVTKSDVKQKLEEVPASDYQTLIVRKYYDGMAIKDFVEEHKIPYRVGSAYYQVTKPEKIQAGKNVAVVEKATGKMYSGVQARKLIGLPAYEVKAKPADFTNFDLFVESTSTNRKLVGDTHLIVFK